MLVGQTRFLKENINSFIAFAFIGAYALGVGLVLWHAVLGTNPIATALAREAQTANQKAQ
jgi:hypothetical protein